MGNVCVLNLVTWPRLIKIKSANKRFPYHLFYIDYGIHNDHEDKFISFLTSFLQVLNKFYFSALVFLKCTVSLLFLFSILVNCHQYIRVKSFWDEVILWLEVTITVQVLWRFFFIRLGFLLSHSAFNWKMDY